MIRKIPSWPAREGEPRDHHSPKSKLLPATEQGPGRASLVFGAAADFFANRPGVLAFVYVLAFLPVTLLLSSRTPLTSDEIFTVYTSRLSSVQEIWHVLAQGFDLQPPLIFLATRYSQALFGNSEWAIRLPETIGVLAMGLCLMTFVARRTNAIWGFLTAVFVSLTGAYPFAINARPYGLVLGFSGAALVSWQSSAGGRLRRPALLCLGVSLALAVSTHYYAGLILIPLAAGEATRNLANRRLDMPVWAAFGASIASLLLCLPLLRQAMSVVAGWQAAYLKPASLWNTYAALASNQTAIGMVFLLAVAAATNRAAAAVRRATPFPPAETVAAAGFLLLPAAGFVLAWAVTHNLTGRYVIGVTMGAALLYALMAHRLTGGNSRGGFALAILLVGVFAAHVAVGVRSASLEGAEPVVVDSQYADLPVVVGSGLDFPAAWYYASSTLRSRLVFVSEPELAARYSPGGVGGWTNSSIAAAAPVFHWRVQRLAEFRPGHRRFLLSWTAGERWMLPVYLEFGARIEPLLIDGQCSLFLITDEASGMPAKEPEDRSSARNYCRKPESSVNS